MKEQEKIPEFGIKRENEERRDGGCGVIFDPETKKFAVGREESGRLRLFGGGVSSDEEMQQGVLREIEEESGLHDFLHIEKLAEVICHFHNSFKKVNRVAYSVCFFIIIKSRDLKPTELEEHEKFVLDWVTAEELLSNWESRNEGKDHDHWIYFLKKSLARAKELGV